MKIYTKTGDAGQTGLFGGARVSKADARVDAYGEVDELNCAIGAARAHCKDPAIDTVLNQAQNQLFALGAELARVPGKDVDLGVDLLGASEVNCMEQSIDTLERDLSPLKTFILPGGSVEASLLHMGRAVCRRAERKLVALSDTSPVRPELLRYLNRLSDLLFVLARHANFRARVADVPWLGRKASDHAHRP